ncbi:hypothetical protein EYF80_018908 [Liparis tanakae]|uniref:Uncharacterized protein n=1 Tax=Liparis tanakae TaxID=230148 RepID=A0A4Z2I125_9TELE|nr:hypothetical protein EYF80_018908 [Liparis tanakae]
MRLWKATGAKGLKPSRRLQGEGSVKGEAVEEWGIEGVCLPRKTEESEREGAKEKKKADREKGDVLRVFPQLWLLSSCTTRGDKEGNWIGVGE